MQNTALRSPPAHPGVSRRIFTSRRLLLSAVGTVAFLLGTSAWVVYCVLPFALIRPSRDERYVKYRDVTPKQFGLQAEDLWVEAEPGLWLRGWFFRAPAGAGGERVARGTILLLHGSSSCKQSMLGAARMFTAAGFNCLAFDMRAHGESGGMYRTFGYYEQRDCARIFDEAEVKTGPLGPRAVYGKSMGAAIALQAMAYDPRIRCGIAESSFATLREIARDYMEQLSGVPFKFVADIALKRAGEIAHFSVDEVRPEASARQIVRPVLLVHGTADVNISIHYGERIFRNLSAPGCEWDAVAGGTHHKLWQTGAAAYERKLAAFMTKYDR